jgi:hypothetical protein
LCPTQCKAGEKPVDNPCPISPTRFAPKDLGRTPRQHAPAFSKLTVSAIPVLPWLRAVNVLSKSQNFYRRMCWAFQ